MSLMQQADRALRATAYDLLCVRDGLAGWKPHRDGFLRLASSDGESLRATADARLQNVLRHAFASSIYYRDVLPKRVMEQRDLRASEAIAELPFLTKDIIRERRMEMVSSKYPIEELLLSYTGGTTGTQTAFYLNRDCMIARTGRRWGMHELCSYAPGMRRGLVWGVHADLPGVGLRASLKQRFRKFASGDETLCCTVMSDQDLGAFHKALMKFRPEVLYGYPSALVHFGQFVEDRRLSPIRVRTVITTAERLSAEGRKKLEQFFGAEVFSLYATREYGCIGYECRIHRGFHLDIGSVYVEIVRDGQILGPGQSGEIVVTDLLNYGMPFIRSRTGDMGRLSTDPCNCGSALPLLTGLEGRTADVLYRPDGSVVPGLMLTDLFTDIPSISFLQFAQDHVERMEVRLVVTQAYTEEDRRHAERQIREIMGPEIAIDFKIVDEIQRNPRSGKLREIVSSVGDQKEILPDSGSGEE